MAASLPDIDDTTYQVDSSAPNYGYEFNAGTGRSVEFICVHDTEDTASNAAATARWCVSADNTDSSWHFSVDDTSIYQTLPLTINGWHAGDGRNIANLKDTGIPFKRIRPEVTAVNGYYYIDGEATTIATPQDAPLCDLGIICVKLPNGNYGIPTTYYNSTYGCIVCHGGNYNSIGIETCVKQGQDLYLVWHNTAKLVAKLLKDFDLGLDRVTFHNQFSGKTCPKTMINADKVNFFLKMVEVEYKILNMSDNSISFSVNENFTNGRLSEVPADHITYKVNGKLKLTSRGEN